MAWSIANFLHQMSSMNFEYGLIEKACPLWSQVISLSYIAEFANVYACVFIIQIYYFFNE